MTDSDSTLMLTDNPLSLASQLPQWFSVYQIFARNTEVGNGSPFSALAATAAINPSSS